MNFDGKMKDFDANRDPNASYLVFRYNPNGDGMAYMAHMIQPGEEMMIMLPHTTIDAYLYGLQDLKQRLELQRIKNDKA